MYVHYLTSFLTYNMIAFGNFKSAHIKSLE